MQEDLRCIYVTDMHMMRAMHERFRIMLLVCMHARMLYRVGAKGARLRLLGAGWSRQILSQCSLHGEHPRIGRTWAETKRRQ